MADGATELGRFVAPPVMTLYCVIAVPVKADVPFPVSNPVSVAAPVPPCFTGHGIGVCVVVLIVEEVPEKTTPPYTIVPAPVIALVFELEMVEL